MRGIVTGGDDEKLVMNSNDAASDHDRLELTPTGFKLTDGDGNLNGSNDKIVYIAIRRPDPLVGKPPAAGVNAFAMDVGNSQSIVPNFNSSFPDALGYYREFTTTHDWYTGGRLAGATYWRTDASNAASAMTGMDYDTNVGWTRSSGGSALQAWMWKRGPGFDLVTYTGGGSGDIIPHNLNAVPEMIWVKSTSATEPWAVYHYGANGGTTPWNYYGKLNMSSSFSSSPNMWNQTAPTSTVFTVIADNMVNGSPKTYVAMLFTSVTGISKVGYYTGSGSSNTQTITTGFQPRFVIIKDYTGGSNPWYVLDTARGWGSGNDDILQLNDTAAALTGNDWGEPTATGFTVTGGGINLNSSSNKYIYYAHA